ncbi:MAG: LysM peptidoglycan-binding domain-containing protein, partial [Acidimicrobiales bacterium]
APTTTAAPEPEAAPTITAAPEPESAGGSHTVSAGETLWSIADQNDTTVEVLVAVNDLDGNAVQLGQVLELPSNGPAAPTTTRPPTSGATSATPTVVSIYRVQPGDTASSIARRFAISVDALLAVNQLTTVGEIEVGEYIRIPSSS